MDDTIGVHNKSLTCDKTAKTDNICDNDRMLSRLGALDWAVELQPQRYTVSIVGELGTE